MIDPKPTSPVLDDDRPKYNVEQLAAFDRVLVNPQEGDKLAFDLRYSEGAWTLTCDQLPGLLLFSKDFLKVCDKIGHVTKKLHYLMRHGKIVGDLP